MIDLFSVAALAASVISLASLALLLGYFPTLRDAAKSYRDSSVVISQMMEELNSRATAQDKRLVDVQVRLDVLEERWLRSGWASSRPFNSVDMKTNQYDQNLGSFQPGRSSSRLRVPTGLPRFARPPKKISRPTRAELIILQKLREGQLTAPEVKGILGSSREHAARVMKSLADKGLVVRDLTKRPYAYELSDTGRDAVTRV